MLDANANRAREGLRVLEDYARFKLNDDALSDSLKQLRHALTSATAPLLSDAIHCRDTPGDVGRGHTTAAETKRADLGEIVVAAGKRLGEAMRVIEETCKIFDPPAAEKIKQARYQAYELERRLAATLRCDGRLAQASLCVLITEAICRRPWFDTAEQAIRGGADCLQLREKSLESGELLERAKKLTALCRVRGVLCIINDRPDIALLSGADGVHVGQGDLPVREVRKMLGDRAMIGVSTHRIEQARQAVRDGADYLGAGPVFPSATKPRNFVAGCDYLRQLAAEVTIPAFAIAGIDSTNLDAVLATGIRRVAVTAAVVGARDVAGAVREIKFRLLGAASRQ